jgi:hypothetical protein
MLNLGGREAGRAVAKQRAKVVPRIGSTSVHTLTTPAILRE